jgi:hypothetical protein
MPVLTWATQHRYWMLGIVFVGIVVLVAAGFWYFVLRSPSTRVGLHQALRLYRLNQTADTSQRTDLPTSGVYRFTTSGSEHLSMGGISRSFPAVSDMIVTQTAGCATMKWDPLVEHMEGLVECAQKNGALDIQSALSYEQIAGTQTTSVIKCPTGTTFVPSDPTVGERWHATCHSKGERVVFSGQILGQANVDVGGRQVPALHMSLNLSFSGSQSGTNPNSYWVSRQNGLILRQDESVDVAQKTGPFGSVRYTEQMAIALDSVTPIR